MYPSWCSTDRQPHGMHDLAWQSDCNVLQRAMGIWSMSKKVSVPTSYRNEKDPYLKRPKNSWLSIYQMKRFSRCRFREGQITQDMWEYNRPGASNPLAMDRYWSVACYELGHASRGWGTSEWSFIYACTESRLREKPSAFSPVHGRPIFFQNWSLVPERFGTTAIDLTVFSTGSVWLDAALGLDPNSMNWLSG